MNNDAAHCIIVSDEQGLRESLSLSLRMKNFNVTSTSDGLQALFLMEEKLTQGVQMSFAVIGNKVKTISPLEVVMFIRARFPDQTRLPILVYVPKRTVNEETIGIQELKDAGANVTFESLDLHTMLKAIANPFGTPAKGTMQL